MPSQAQWSKLNEDLLQVGAEDDQTRFCVNALVRLKNVISFDQGRVYFLDEDGHVYDEFLMGVSKKTTKAKAKEKKTKIKERKPKSSTQTVNTGVRSVRNRKK